MAAASHGSRYLKKIGNTTTLEGATYFLDSYMTKKVILLQMDGDLCNLLLSCIWTFLKNECIDLAVKATNEAALLLGEKLRKKNLIAKNIEKIYSEYIKILIVQGRSSEINTNIIPKISTYPKLTRLKTYISQQDPEKSDSKSVNKGQNLKAEKKSKSVTATNGEIKVSDPVVLQRRLEACQMVVGAHCNLRMTSYDCIPVTVEFILMRMQRKDSRGLSVEMQRNQAFANFDKLARNLINNGCYEDAEAVLEQAIGLYERANKLTGDFVVIASPGKDLYLTRTFSLIHFGRIYEAEILRKRIPMDDPEQSNIDFHKLLKQLERALQADQKQDAHKYYDRFAKLGFDLLAKKNEELAYKIFAILTVKLFHPEYGEILKSCKFIGKILIDKCPETLILQFLSHLIGEGNQSLQEGAVISALAIAKALLVTLKNEFYEYYLEVLGIRELYNGLLSMPTKDLSDKDTGALNTFRIQFIHRLRFLESAEGVKEAKNTVESKLVIPIVGAVAALESRRRQVERRSQTPSPPTVLAKTQLLPGRRRASIA